jgi:ribonuclease BN (tRNA processing enzyme)
MIRVDVLYSAGGIATQILLSHSEGDCLVDAGDGVLRDLVARRYDFARLKGVLLTHEDFDHISDTVTISPSPQGFFPIPDASSGGCTTP